MTETADHTRAESSDFDLSGFSSALDMSERVVDEEVAREIDAPFDPEKIDVRTRTMTVDLLLSRLNRGALQLDPDFQRKMGLWDDTRQSQLIESLLLRIPLPTFYAAEVDRNDTWAVVDGIQRLTAIARFIEPEAVDRPRLTLKGMQYLDRLNGSTFEDLPGGLQTRLRESEFVVHVIALGTDDQVKFNIFARINTGGLPLTHQELRHALIPGRAREFLAELATSDAFQAATYGSVSDARMSDEEMVLRFLAFRITPPEEYNQDDFDDFLRAKMRELNGLPEDRLTGLRRDFAHAMDAAHRIFAEHAFRRQRRGVDYRSIINKALFEAVAVNLADRTPQQIDRLVGLKVRVNEALVELLEEREFDRAISQGTGGRSRVRTRFSLVNNLFGRFDGGGE